MGLLPLSSPSSPSSSSFPLLTARAAAVRREWVEMTAALSALEGGGGGEGGGGEEGGEEEEVSRCVVKALALLAQGDGMVRSSLPPSLPLSLPPSLPPSSFFGSHSFPGREHHH